MSILISDIIIKKERVLIPDSVCTLSQLSFNLIRNKHYIEYFDECGYDELLLIDSNELTPIDYMFILSNIDTVNYVINNTPIDIIHKINIEQVLECISIKLSHTINNLHKSDDDKMNIVDIYYQKIIILLKVMLRIINTVKVTDHSYDMIKLFFEIIMMTSIENKLFILGGMYMKNEEFSEKLLNSFTTYEEQNMIYEKIILHKYNTMMYTTYVYHLFFLVIDFVDLCYSDEIISNHKTSPLNLFVKCLNNNIKHIDVCSRLYIPQLSMLIKLFGQDFLLTDMVIDDEKTMSVIECIVDIMNSISSVNHDCVYELYEKNKDILKDLVVINECTSDDTQKILKLI
jgi:hypothetical protein